MTRIVPLVPGLSTVVASGPQYGVKYTLVGPDGGRAVFNDPSDNDYVGVLSNISGLDSPDLRESADDLIGDDGGVHGNFYHGRRPIVIEGQIDNRPGAIHSELLPTGELYTNLVTNPSAEVTDIGSLGSVSGSSTGLTAATYARVGGSLSSLQHLGTFTMQYTVHRNDSVSIVGGSTLTGTSGIPVTAGNWYGARVWARWGQQDTAINTSQCRIYWYNSSGSQISSSNGPGITQGVGQGQFRYVAAQAPAGATFAAVRYIFATNNTTGLDKFYSLWTDGYALFDLGSSAPANTDAATTDADVPQYFDGTFQPGIQEPYYTDWTGAAHASTSRKIYVVNTPFTEGRVRNIRSTAIQRASNAMRTDAELRWQVEGGVEQTVRVRRQQPTRITGGFNKQFQIALVAADPRIYASAIKEETFSPNVLESVENSGTMSTPPTVTIFGPSTGTMNTIEVHNHSTGEFLVLAPAYALGVGQSIIIDFANKTIQRETGTNIYDQIVFASSSWWQLAPGPNNIEYHASGTTTNSTMVLRWQDAWV
jgi:hypothetical protein